MQAASSDEFIHSIGVVTHWNYPDTPYGFAFKDALKLLIESGIRHIRDGFSDRILTAGEYGIKSTVIADLNIHSNGGRGTVNKIKERIKAINREGNYIVAVEGPNEPDLFWERYKKVYRGYGYIYGSNGFIRGAVEFQKHLYKTIKGDPATSGITVIGMALGKTYDPVGRQANPLGDGQLSDYVDWGNFHPYPGGNPFCFPVSYAGIEKYHLHGNFPSNKLDEYPYAFNVYAPPYTPKPMAATETGYSTYCGGISENIHGKYIPRLFCEYFRLGIKRAYIYELVDEFKDPDKSNREANFGLLRRDLSPKPGYTALKSLIGLLQDKGGSFTPGGLDYELSVKQSGNYDRTYYVHHILLQKSDGDFYLLLWHEISNEDMSVVPHRQIVHPPIQAVLTISQSISRAVVYSYDDSWNLIPTEIAMINNTIRFEVPDQVIIIRLTPNLISPMPFHNIEL